MVTCKCVNITVTILSDKYKLQIIFAYKCIALKNIRFLNSYKIPDALPSNSKFFNFQEKSFYKYNNNIYFAGDYLSSPCLDGAIQSGINLVESLRK